MPRKKSKLQKLMINRINTMPVIRVIFIALFICVQTVLSAQEWLVPIDKRSKLSSFTFNDSTRVSGKGLFDANCKACHGLPGEGSNNKAMNPVPPDPISEQMQKNSDGELYYKIREGNNRGMLSFKDRLSPDQIWGVISYLRSFNKNYTQQVEKVKEKTLYGGAVKIVFNYLADSNQLQSTVIGTKNGKTELLAEAGIKLYAKRWFGTLPIGEELKTDKTGNVVFKLPRNLPGDSIGNLTLIAKISDQEMYGNVTSDTVLKAGQPVNKPSLVAKRAMYNIMRKAPIWLLLVYFSGVIVVWTFIILILLQVRKIYFIGKKTENTIKTNS
jgi:hypothetical protein